MLALQDRLAYGPTFESALAGLFGGAALSTTALATPMARGPGAQSSAAASEAAVDIDARIADAAKDLAEYQRLTAEGKLGEAGQKLEQLKRTLEELNKRRR